MTSDLTLSRAALAIILDPLTHEPIDPSSIGPFFWDVFRIVYRSVPGTPIAGVASTRPAWTASLARQAISHTAAQWRAGGAPEALQTGLTEFVDGCLAVPIVLVWWWVWPPTPPLPYDETTDPYLTSPEGMPGLDLLAAANEFHRAAEVSTEETAAALPKIRLAAGVAALPKIEFLSSAFRSAADRLYQAGLARLAAKCE